MTQRTKFWNKSKVITSIAILLGFAVTYKFGLPAYKTYSAKHDLEKIGIPFSEQKFIESACSGDQGSVQLFIQAGMNVNLLAAPGKKDGVPKGALHCAAIKGNLAMAKSLLGQGADINLADDEGNTPLYYLAKINNYGRDENKDNLEIAKLFVSSHADLNKSGEAGPPLIAAIASNNFELADLLIEKGADVKGVGKDGSTALITLIMQFHRADRTPAVERAKSLVKAGVNINAANKNGITALMAACANRSVPLIGALLDIGADPNIASNDQSPVLLSLSNPEGFKLLVSHGADLNIKVNGQSLLHRAVSYSDPTVLGTLLASGKFDLNSKNDRGETALFMAAGGRNNAMVQQLLASGANPNVANNNLDTPLIRAVNSNSVEIVRTLIEWSANVNAKDAAGHTPLFYAKIHTGEINSSNADIQSFRNGTAFLNGRVIRTPVAEPLIEPGRGNYNRYPAQSAVSAGFKPGIPMRDPIVDMLTKAGAHI